MLIQSHILRKLTVFFETKHTKITFKERRDMVSVFASLFRGCLDGRKLGFHLCLHVWSVMMCFSG